MIKKTLILARQGAIGTLIFAVAFITIEPAISYATVSVTSQFTISQTVTTEIAFATPASNIIMTTAGGSTSLGGLTGGTSNGSTTVAVTTNNLTGYNMTIMASTSLGMQGVASSTNHIPAYITSTAGVPDYTFNTTPGTAPSGFGYNASSTDVTQLFKSGGTGPCNTSTINNSSFCWLAATTTPVTIINRNIPTPVTGATTTLSFRVYLIPNSMIPNDTYVATTTLTATTN